MDEEWLECAHSTIMKFLLFVQDGQPEKKKREKRFRSIHTELQTYGFLGCG